MFVVLIFALLLCFLLSSPRIHLQLLSEEDYLSRQRTSFLNGFFIVFVFIRHITQYDIVPSEWERMALYVMPRGQLLVTPFLFFSGYGLMCSMMRSRYEYTGKLLTTRFPKLWLHFVLCIACYWCLSSLLLGKEYSLSHICLAAVTWTSFGNSTWYIGVTLLAYLILAISSYVTGRRGNILMWMVSFFLTVICLQLILLYKEPYWGNTALCIHAGMAYAMFRGPIEGLLRRIPLPTLFLGGALMWLGCVTHRTWLYIDLLGNVGSILYASGICLLQGCISYKRPFPLLVWCGGPALFFIYILQRLPMMIGAYFGWNHDYREVYVAGCFVLTILLALLAIPLFKKLDKVLFS